MCATVCLSYSWILPQCITLFGMLLVLFDTLTDRSSTLCNINFNTQHSLKLILMWPLFNMKMSETDLATSHVNTFNSTGCCLNSPPTGLTLKKKLKPLPSFGAWWGVGRYSKWHSPIVVQASIWMRQSDKYSLRIFSENQWASPSMIWKKPTTREGKIIDNGQSREIVNQVLFVPTLESLVAMFPTTSR